MNCSNCKNLKEGNEFSDDDKLISYHIATLIMVIILEIMITLLSKI